MEHIGWWGDDFSHKTSGEKTFAKLSTHQNTYKIHAKRASFCAYSHVKDN